MVLHLEDRGSEPHCSLASYSFFKGILIATGKCLISNILSDTYHHSFYPIPSDPINSTPMILLNVVALGSDFHVITKCPLLVYHNPEVFQIMLWFHLYAFHFESYFSFLLDIVIRSLSFRVLIRGYFRLFISL